MFLDSDIAVEKLYKKLLKLVPHVSQIATLMKQKRDIAIQIKKQ